MDRLGQWCLNACCYLLFTLFAFIIAFGFVGLFYPGLQTEEKSFGPEEQRFYLLLLDAADGMTVAGHDKGFLYGMSDAERERFAGLLQGIRYKRDCTLGKSIAVDGGISCIVNGNRMDFVGHIGG